MSSQIPLVPAHAGTQLLCLGLLPDSRFRGNERGPARLSSFRDLCAAGCGYNAAASIGKLQAAGLSSGELPMLFRVAVVLAWPMIARLMLSGVFVAGITVGSSMVRAQPWQPRDAEP